MNTRAQIFILVAFLLIVGIGLTIYKCYALGFMFTPGEETVWQVQTRMQFDAEGGPAKVSLIIPEEEKSRKVVFREKLSDDYECVFVEEDNMSKAVWTRDDAEGMQVIYFRADFYRLGSPASQAPPSKDSLQKVLAGPYKLAGVDVLMRARQTAGSELELALNVLGLMDEERKDPHVQVLLEGVHYRSEYMDQVAKVLALDGIHSKVVRGLRLSGKYTQRSITTFIQVFIENKWVLLDPESLTELPFSEALLWPVNTRSLLDVYGGTNSSMTISVTSVQKSAGQLAVDAGRLGGSKLIDFSIYSLPIQDQNTFKLLLLIPIGALVVVILDDENVILNITLIHLFILCIDKYQYLGCG